MEAIDIMLIVLTVVTAIGFGTMFIIIVRRILEDNPASKNKNKPAATSKHSAQV